MAINVFEPFTNPVSGETFKCLSSDEQAYVFEWTVQPAGYIPFEHVHLQQDEVFHVKQGEVKFLIGGEQVIVRAGETATVKIGQRHIAFNNQNSIMQCIVEFRPGLDTLTGFQCFAGMTIDGEYDKQGRINIPKMGFFLKLMNCQAMTRPTNIPAPVFGLALNVFYMFGRLRGWENDFMRYTGLEHSREEGLQRI